MVPHDGCPVFHYAINGMNCGACLPRATTSNTSTCTNFNSTLLSSTKNMCNFTVQSVICESVAGDINSLLIYLKGVLIVA